MHEAPASPRPAPGKRISFALAVLMHLGLAAVLIYGIHWQTQKPATVTVDLVRAVPPAPTSAPESKPEPKPEHKPDPKPEPKPEPKVEPKPPKPIPTPEIAQKEKEKPKPPKPEPKPEPEPAKPAADPFKEQLRREAEQLQQRKASAAAAQELAELKAQQAGGAQAGEIDKYISAIRGKVRGNIVLPPDIKGNPEAEFEVTQLPSGEVLNVRLLKSSGHAAYDAATERAIRKSSPLPKPGKSELFDRTLKLKFRPQED
jgi:colicin import membrane protein